MSQDGFAGAASRHLHEAWSWHWSCSNQVPGSLLSLEEVLDENWAVPERSRSAARVWHADAHADDVSALH